MSYLSHISLLILVLLQSILASKIENRVRGGKGFESNKHGYLVQLDTFYKPFFMKAGFCSGSIISAQWIISAAHCFPNSVYNFATVYQQWSSNPIAVSMHIEVHPGFIYDVPSYRAMEKDLALLKTVSEIDLNYDTTWPIKVTSCLVSFGSLGSIAGYGSTEPGLAPPREGEVHISECEYNKGESVLCSYDDVLGDSGDSGGPLVYNETLVGVMSASVKFARHGTVYTNVFRHLNWIYDVIDSP